MSARRILVTGATGYIGGRLIPRLIEAGYAVRCMARDAKRLDGRFPGAEIVEGDVLDEKSLRAACEGMDAAYYLVHSMSDSLEFEERDRTAATLFGRIARESHVQRVVYLGGLGTDDDKLSHHLRSRHEVGEILRASGVQCIEFRAAMIVGSGSISFEMLRYLTERLPVMIAPRWVTTLSQPISVRDVLLYLIAALDLPSRESKIYEIGGAETITYREMMLRYARLRNLKRRVIIVPFFTPRLSSYWVHIVTPIPARLAQPLILGLSNEVVVRDPSAAADFPQIVPDGFDRAVTRALDRYRTNAPETTWFDAFDVRGLPANFSGVREGMLIDRRECVARTSPRALASVFSQLGGRGGWLYGNWLWRLRGIMDRAVGGVGLRRGRRSESDLRLGDAVDFWRVEAYEPGHLLRLRAEMKLPGDAWLEFSAEPLPDGTARLTQTAFFEPRGLFGVLYWYAVAPFHALIFGGMAHAIAARAERGDLRS
ncbi:MAG: SDR family oxidoreductase [Candidatus Eremiobacteraeota bacterium]|nr:SDR family oxidoreductase [Candidatus Eremiobacteraeota bacterium]